MSLSFNDDPEQCVRDALDLDLDEVAVVCRDASGEVYVLASTKGRRLERLLADGVDLT
ncbi:hypothetical protein CcrKarma_gp328 [Caulobacter virus Karma]|uniref:Uncharacterized protein n=6 Tax=Viruses TaxID=10239 RepID=K4JS58_9CAUD|nr:hypothetical protein D865_gp105 [Caulobacter phage phiCbK]YP_006989005.1 hypothetical protein CcrMagneto_gp323 [Caulobacter virus Magneto]YP_006989708.1 hypothetical protein CcrKarma_gp328 [Caulobacter virus Karma]YP_006990053.1 hypothetical protein D870_gp101 [Caulobacter phage CcrSwift]ARB13849.1 hypothetical protein Ccr10_gp319 [Caulobacter phage Ccr10]ARB14194.1 hypothetical protein Ccr2_gp318 [Caulobacter phage Ccr2]ARB14534.1 hypothetical protein Ccr5_gp314 [Caulobacter phage Ccr5]A